MAVVVSKPIIDPAAKFVVPSSVATSASVRALSTARAAPAWAVQRPFVFQPGRAEVAGIVRAPAAIVVLPV